ncbi:hypothetical protein D3C81_1666460 [compost metagenome]
MNYAFLVALFAAAAMIQLRFASEMVPTELTLKDALQLVLMGAVFIVISLNLPSLASQLAGGVGISSMVGKVSGAARAISALRGGGRNGGGQEAGGGTGGSMKGK